MKLLIFCVVSIKEVQTRKKLLPRLLQKKHQLILEVQDSKPASQKIEEFDNFMPRKASSCLRTLTVSPQPRCKA